MTFESITFTARQIERLRDHLLREDGLERATMLYCSWSGNRLLCEEVHPVPDEKLGCQSATGCRPELVVEREHMQACRDRRMHPVIVHSHPFAVDPRFSGRDESLMGRLHEMVTALFDDLVMGFAVVGKEGIVAAVSDRKSDGIQQIPVQVVGDRTLDTPVNCCGVDLVDKNVEDEVIEERDDRTVLAITEEGYRRLAATHVVVVGVGGLGSIIAEQLALYGVGELTLVDPDVVEESNRNRMKGVAPEDVGRPKVDVVAEHIDRMNPSVDVTAVEARAEDACDRLKAANIIVAGLDRVSTRIWLNRFAVRHLIEYVDAGVRIQTGGEDGCVTGMNGVVQFVQPGATACYDCLNRGDRERARIERLSDEELEEEIERGYVDGSVLSPEPAVVPLNGVAASKAVQLVAGHVTGYMRPAHEVADYVRFDLVENEFSEMSTACWDDCVTCGINGVLGRGDREPPMDSVDLQDASFVTELTELEEGRS